MNLNIFNTKVGKIILSIIWGFGLSALFRKACKGRNCILIKGIDPNKIKDKVFQFEDKCYKYETSNVSCNKSNNIMVE